jgi:hypothetical protein
MFEEYAHAIELFLRSYPLNVEIPYLANPTSDFNDFFVWVLLIIMKRLWFYLLSLIPLVISPCLSSRPGAESTVVTSVFKDL